MYHRMLVPLDGSATAERGLREAIGLAVDQKATHGRRGISRLTMGSEAELVVRSSPVPVLLLRREEPRP